MMDFTKVSFKAEPIYCEILTAELAELGYDTFEETETGLDAYIETNSFRASPVEKLVAKYEDMTSLSYTTEAIAKVNWNEEWEKNYEPIEVDDRCRVRATFHAPDNRFDYEIVIIPKMSFGTGHHATTHSMLKLQLDFDFTDKSVLDLGTGTGILAIMAHKLGASSLECTDVDTWCIENSEENFGLNDMADIPAHLGAIRDIQLKSQRYDVVLVNINKNVLLDEMPQYAELLQPTATLFLSGFYESDIPDLMNSAEQYNLSLTNTVIKDNWAALQLTKY